MTIELRVGKRREWINRNRKVELQDGATKRTITLTTTYRIQTAQEWDEQPSPWLDTDLCADVVVSVSAEGVEITDDDGPVTEPEKVTAALLSQREVVRALAQDYVDYMKTHFQLPGGRRAKN